MNKLKRNPLLQVAKCEMCPNLVTNFVTGLCGRCTSIWANREQLGRISAYHVMAATVNMARGNQDAQSMDPTFRQAIAKVRSKRSQKFDLFQKLRNQFLDSILIQKIHNQPPGPVKEDDYWNVPEIVDSDYLMFQHQIDLLEGINMDPAANSDLNNNKLPEK